MEPIYLDYNATTPIDPAVAAAMIPYIYEHFGNPSSSHAFGQRAKTAVDKARCQVADLLGCLPDEVILTSGGTESNNHAIKGVSGAYREKGNHIITSSVEHPAVLDVCAFLEGHGFDVTYLPVDSYGMVNPRQLEWAITPQTILVSVMHANNEIGTIQPISEISEIAHRNGVLAHADCAQSVGKIPVSVDELGVDLLSIAGHKLYAPKGIGALYIRSGVRLEKLMHGAGHEMGWRAGTENVIEAAGLGMACQLIAENLAGYCERMTETRDMLEAQLGERLPDMKINGHPEHRLPNTSSISFPSLEADTILSNLEYVAASAGAACHSDQVEISSVLQAMRLPLDEAMGTLRFSTGRYTTRDEITRAVEDVAQAVEAARSRSPQGV